MGDIGEEIDRVHQAIDPEWGDKNTPHIFEGLIWFITPKAILFQSHYWEGPLWFPMSQVEIIHNWDSEEKVVIVQPWLCNKRKIHEFVFYSEEEIEKFNER